MSTANWVFFDLECAAPLYKDCIDIAKARVIQVGLASGSGQPLLTLDINPGFDVPEEITALTGITNERLRAAEPFAAHAVAIADLLRGRSIAGFNIHRFDVPLLAEEFERAGLTFDWQGVTAIDVGVLFMQQQPRNLAAAAMHYLGAVPDFMHDAAVDAATTAKIMAEMRVHHPLLNEKSDAELQQVTRYDKRMADPAGRLMYDHRGELCYATRNNHGVRVAAEPNYARWMLGRDFPLATKRMLADELARLQTRQPDLSFGD